MPATTVTTQDTAMGAAIRAELKNMLEQGLTDGTITIASPFGGVSMAPVLMDMWEMAAIAVLRVFKSVNATELGTEPPWPLRMIQVSKLALPTPTDNVGSLIYVTDDVGGAVTAFSDGVHWRRMTDRAIIS